MEIKRLSAHVPVSWEQLIDAGATPPPGYEPPKRPSVSRWRRAKFRIRESVWSARVSVAKAIAGYEWPEDGGLW